MVLVLDKFSWIIFYYYSRCVTKREGDRKRDSEKNMQREPVREIFREIDQNPEGERIKREKERYRQAYRDKKDK